MAYIGWSVFLFGLLFVVSAVVLLHLAFMTTFGQIELALTREGLLRLREGGLGIYTTRTAAWSDLISAESREFARFTPRYGVRRSQACLLRLRPEKEWRLETDGNREEAAWIARYLCERIHLSRP